MIAIPSQTMDHHSPELQHRVALMLLQRHVTFGSRLRIEVQEGVVTLSGQVPTFYQRQLIKAFTRRVAGVLQVIDQLQVVSPISAASTKRGDAPIEATVLT